MTSPIQPNKTYGVLHTESFFSFLGFAKKVGSDEIQKVDVFLDDKLIDTIEANEFIQKIDDMYDVESKAFTYNLPVQYIGKKAIISFKNHHSGEELLNSPYTLIDKNHEKFNEAKFLHSLEGNFDNEKIQNINPKDSIGFLSTEDNLLNKDLIKLINIFLEKNIDSRFKVFYFNNEQKKLISEKFNKYQSKIDFIMPKDIYDIANNTSIYIHSSTANEKPKDTGYYKIWQVLNQIKANMFLINIFEAIDEKEYSKSLKLVDNCKIEFEKSIVSKIFENDDRYNEFKFVNNLNQNMNKERVQSINLKNSIGFLATENNLKDDDFMSYINDFIKTFPQITFYGFYFNEEKPKKELWNSAIISSINDIENKVSILITNFTKSNYDKIIYEKYHNHTAVVGFAGSDFSKKLIKDIQIESVINIFKENLNLFNLNSDDIDKYPNHLFLSSLVLTKELDINLLNILLANQTFKEWQFNMINIGSNNLIFLKRMNFLRKSIQDLFKSKNK